MLELRAQIKRDCSTLILCIYQPWLNLMYSALKHFERRGAGGDLVFSIKYYLILDTLLSSLLLAPGALIIAV